MEDPQTDLTVTPGGAEILLSGLYDSVSLADMRFLVSLAERDDVPYRDREPVELRRKTLAAITQLVENDLAELGDLVPAPDDGRGRPLVGFVAWALDKKEALNRVGTEWWDPARELFPGNVCWLENTSAGNELARRIAAARDTGSGNV